MKYQNLLFDLDHTLWDFERNSKATLDELFTEFELNRYFQSLNEFLDIYHRINNMLWSQYGKGKISKNIVKYHRFIHSLREGGCDDNNFANLLAEEYVKRSPCKTFLIDGAMEVVQSLKGSYNMHIITNGFSEVQFKKIINSGLLPDVDSIYTSEDAGYQKPDAGFFQYVFTNNQIRPNNSLVIGDNLKTDILGAKDVGIDTVFFNPDNKKDSIGATYVVGNLIEIMSLL